MERQTSLLNIPRQFMFLYHNALIMFVSNDIFNANCQPKAFPPRQHSSKTSLTKHVYAHEGNLF